MTEPIFDVPLLLKGTLVGSTVYLVFPSKPLQYGIARTLMKKPLILLHQYGRLDAVRPEFPISLFPDEIEQFMPERSRLHLEYAAQGYVAHHLLIPESSFEKGTP